MLLWEILHLRCCLYNHVTNLLPINLISCKMFLQTFFSVPLTFPGYYCSIPTFLTCGDMFYCQYNMVFLDYTVFTLRQLLFCFGAIYIKIELSWNLHFTRTFYSGSLFFLYFNKTAKQMSLSKSASLTVFVWVLPKRSMEILCQLHFLHICMSLTPPSPMYCYIQLQLKQFPVYFSPRMTLKARKRDEWMKDAWYMATVYNLCKCHYWYKAFCTTQLPIWNLKTLQTSK